MSLQGGAGVTGIVSVFETGPIFSFVSLASLASPPWKITFDGLLPWCFAKSHGITSWG